MKIEEIPKSQLDQIKKHDGIVERITTTGLLLADIGWFAVSKYNKVTDLDKVKVMDHVTIYAKDNKFILRVDIKRNG